jgi:hypothetical protein
MVCTLSTEVLYKDYRVVCRHGKHDSGEWMTEGFAGHIMVRRSPSHCAQRLQRKAADGSTMLAFRRVRGRVIAVMRVGLRAVRMR